MLLLLQPLRAVLRYGRLLMDVHGSQQINMLPQEVRPGSSGDSTLQRVVCSPTPLLLLALLLLLHPLLLLLLHPLRGHLVLLEAACTTCLPLLIKGRWLQASCFTCSSQHGWRYLLI
jgi:hypothetical protein